MRLGLTARESVEVLTLHAIAKAQSESGALDRLFDTSDRAEGVGVVRYSNGFDKNERSGSSCARSRLSDSFRERVLTLAVCKVRPLGPKLEDRERSSHTSRAHVCGYADEACALRVLRPMYPGQFPTLKLNLFSVVLLSSADFIATIVHMLDNRGLPFRWGVVPLVETEDGTRARCMRERFNCDS